jgi:ribose transport system substrate-binding protein
VMSITGIGVAAVSAPSGAAVASASGTAVPSFIPAAVANQYPGYQYFSKLQQNPDPGYKAPSGKFSMCYSSTYLGNAFQEGVVAELQKVDNEYVKAGLASGPLTVTNSNNSASEQLSQLDTLVQKGCNVIYSFPASPTALCAGVAKAVAAGLLYVTIESPVYCPNAINVTWNGYTPEYNGAIAVMKAMGGKGNLVVTQGIPGVAIGTAETFAVKNAVAEYPGVKVLGYVAGEWTPSVAATAMTSFLATHPEPVNGLIDAGAEDVSTEQALLNAGRSVVPENSITGECSVLAFWKAHPGAQAYATDQSPAAASYEAVYVANLMMAGQKPVVGTIFYPVPTITKANFAQWYKPSMTVQSGCIPNTSDGLAVADSYFAPFFKGGSTPKFTPKA